jgi:hypothetical protein
VVEPVEVEAEVVEELVDPTVEVVPDYLCFYIRIPCLFIFKRLYIINI